MKLESFNLDKALEFVIFNLKVPGRMGMIVTLFLISANVYNSVKAPKARGCSYIEIWMIGTQIPILVALFEYAIILYMKKNAKKSEIQIGILNFDNTEHNIEDKIKKIDSITMVISCLYFLTFSLSYWMLALWKHSNNVF